MGRPAKVVFSCEHGGYEIPELWGGNFRGASQVLKSHRGWDPGALDVARSYAKTLSAPCFVTTTSRLLVDCNRSTTNPAIWSQFTKTLPKTDKVEIVQNYYKPHRDRVEQAISDAVASGCQVLHLGVHSFTPELNGVVRDCDFSLLYDPKRIEEAALAKSWLGALKSRAPRWRLRRNYPYRGDTDGFTTYLRRRFSGEEYLGIELEFNHGLLKARKRWDALVADVFAALSEAVSPANSDLRRK